MQRFIAWPLALAALLFSPCLAAADQVKDVIHSDAGHVLALVNRERSIGYDFVPDALVTPEVRVGPNKENSVRLTPEAANALERLFIAAEKEGVTLYAISGYRSYYDQKRLFQDKAEREGEKQAMRTVAPPGTSEHQLGLAMDINGETTLKKGLDEAFAGSPEGIWVAENAARYGFIIRYPKNAADITGYAWEPWHLRYVGAEAATKVNRLGITLEEYHTMLAADGIGFFIRKPKE